MGIDDLDKALECCYKNKADFVWIDKVSNYVFGETEGPNRALAIKLIKRLEADQFVTESVDPVSRHRRYSITFDGIIFYEMGGYKQRIANETSENTRLEKLEKSQTGNQIFLTWLTFFVALGTVIAAVYYLTELYWKYHWFH